MLAEKIETEAPPPPPQQHASFFRQSGWLMIANIAGGILMWAVHLLARPMGKDEYGLFITLLTAVMLVPAVPLQMVFAQQTAKALATGRRGELSGLIRMIFLGLLAGWVLLCVAVFILQGTILKFWGVTDPKAIWITMPILLLTIWAPIFTGMLQGQQNFFWLGWSMMANGVGRLGAAAFAVLVLHKGAFGMMVGVLVGAGVALAIAIWQTRTLWACRRQAFAWFEVLRQVIPLLFGFVFVQFLFTGDTLFVKHYFTEGETGAYGAAGTLSRAIIWLVSPLAAVMFPRVVHSSARTEKTNIVGLVMIGTAILSICGALGLAVLGPWSVGLMFGETFVKVARQVLPWYAAAMVPLALANVMVNSLLAKGRFAVVPFIFLLGIGYAATMVYVNQHGHSLVSVLQTLGGFNLLMLLVCSWFTWGTKAPGEIGRLAPETR
jgi:O-antigen/teichoic acid export membrane protein